MWGPEQEAGLRCSSNGGFNQPLNNLRFLFRIVLNWDNCKVTGSELPLGRSHDLGQGNSHQPRAIPKEAMLSASRRMTAVCFSPAEGLTAHHWVNIPLIPGQNTYTQAFVAYDPSAKEGEWRGNGTILIIGTCPITGSLAGHAWAHLDTAPGSGGAELLMYWAWFQSLSG